MIVVFLVLVSVGWLVVALIAEQERGQVVSISSRLTDLRSRIARTGKAVVARGRRAWEEHRARSRSADAVFGPRAAPALRPSARSAGDGWRSRLVALLELILFVMLIGALFAGAMAAAAMRFSHFGT